MDPDQVASCVYNIQGVTFYLKPRYKPQLILGRGAFGDVLVSRGYSGLCVGLSKLFWQLGARRGWRPHGGGEEDCARL